MNMYCIHCFKVTKGAKNTICECGGELITRKQLLKFIDEQEQVAEGKTIARLHDLKNHRQFGN